MGGDKQKIIWQPLPGAQKRFLKCPVFEVLFEGTRGGGKTDCLIMSFCMQVGQGFGASWKGILFRQTYKQLDDIISKTKKWIPQIWPEAKYNASEHYWHWPGGERLLLRQFKSPDDYWNYHGHEYPWIGWEELCNWPTDEGLKRMMSCCRSSTPGMPRMVRATTNPYGPGHNWVKFRYRLPGSRGTVIKDSPDGMGGFEPERVAIHSSILENKVLLESDPDYIQRIAASARSEAERKAWLEGDWNIVAGGMFDDVWSEANVVPDFDVPSSWRVDRSFDWGSSKPFSVGWWAESDGSDLFIPKRGWISTVRGDLFRIREWYGWTGKPDEGLRMLASDIAKGIREREMRWFTGGRVKPGPADSSIYNVENGRSIDMDMSEPIRMDDGHVYPGITWIPADKRPGSRISGWEVMRRMIRAAGDPMPRERPGLFVVGEHCQEFLRTVLTLPRDEKNMDDVDTNTEDHIADETRYRIRSMERPAPSTHVGMY